MKLLTVSIEKRNSKEYLWGIDSKTNQFFYIELQSDIKDKLKVIGDHLIFREEMVQGTHELKVREFVGVEKNERECLINTLNCMAAYPAVVKDHFVKNNVLKIREFYDLEKYGDIVTANVKICGIDGQYRAIINDSKWTSFWEDSSSESLDIMSFIKVVNGIKNIYLILDYTQPFFGNELIFCGMVVDYG